MGTAVHRSIELFIETDRVPKFEDIFYPLISEQMKIDPDDINWAAAGSQDDPIIRAKAVELGKRCVDNAVLFLDDFEVWEVEYDATGYLPGCEVPVKAYVDLIGEHKKHGPVIVDWKSGKQKPKTALQLETYAALLNQDRQTLIDVGLWAMLNPEASQARPVKGLSSVDAGALGARYQAAYDDIKAKKWKAVPAFDCKFCLQEPNCLVQSLGTKRAKFYDRSEEDGYPF